MRLKTETLRGNNVSISSEGLLVFFLAVTIQAVAGKEVFGDFFTSFHKMEALAHQEHRLLNTLKDYISTQTEKLKLLNFKLEQYKNISLRSCADNLINEPYHTYHLVRRLTREWPHILNLMIHPISIGDNIQDEISLLPNEDKLTSAAKALMRLQDVYKLDSKQLSQEKGNFANLTETDCFEMGKLLLKENNYELATSWLQEAIEKNNIKEKSVLEETIAPYFFLSQFLSESSKGNRPRGVTKILQDLINSIMSEFLSESNIIKQRLFSEGCRGIGHSNTSDMRCFYIHYNNPRLLIAPFKMEEINIDPPILMFHDVISDQEAAEMKTAFIKVKGPCQTLNPNDRYYRTCDVGWVTDGATPASARITRRVGDMTDLDMVTSERNQVACYGLGGAYGLHFDWSGGRKPKASEGARLATLMFYLNDVEEGGFTVFPRINVAVKPVKGSAVFWFNLDHRSERLESSIHGGCPILKGSKWVLNKWIHEVNQAGVKFCPTDEKFPKPRYYMNGIK